ELDGRAAVRARIRSVLHFGVPEGEHPLPEGPLQPLVRERTLEDVHFLVEIMSEDFEGLGSGVEMQQPDVRPRLAVASDDLLGDSLPDPTPGDFRGSRELPVPPPPPPQSEGVPKAAYSNLLCLSDFLQPRLQLKR